MWNMVGRCTWNVEAMVRRRRRLTTLGGDMEVVWCLVAKREVGPTLRGR